MSGVAADVGTAEGRAATLAQALGALGGLDRGFDSAAYREAGNPRGAPALVLSARLQRAKSKVFKDFNFAGNCMLFLPIRRKLNAFPPEN